MGTCCTWKPLFSHCLCGQVGQSVPSIYDRDKTGPPALGSPTHHPWAFQPSRRRCQHWPPSTERGRSETPLLVLRVLKGARHGSLSTLDDKAEPQKGSSSQKLVAALGQKFWGQSLESTAGSLHPLFLIPVTVL